VLHRHRNNRHPRNIIQKFKEKPINLEALFTGSNPFGETEPVTHNGDAEINPDGAVLICDCSSFKEGSD
jgi:hypothetical protein